MLTRAATSRIRDVLTVRRQRSRRALVKHAYSDRLREDFMSGVRSGVNGTPTFFINGARHDGAFDHDNLRGGYRGRGALIRIPDCGERKSTADLEPIKGEMK